MPSSAANKSKKKISPHDLLFSRSGYLIRRLHQLHISMFYEKCANLNITPVQFGILTILGDNELFDQVSLGKELGMDRSTMSNVIVRLESRKLVRRQANERDRRSKCVRITVKGKKCLDAAQGQVEKVQDDVVSALPKKERKRFILNLRRLVEASNSNGRTALRLVSD